MPSMLIEIPEDINGIGVAVVGVMEVLKATLARTGGGKVADYRMFEDELGAATAALERACHGRMLAALDVNCARVSIGGVAYANVGRYDGTYYTLAGPVTVPRSLYRKVGERNGKTVDAIAARTGAVDGVWLPGTAQRMAYLMAQGTSREAEQTARELGRATYSRSAFDDVAHAVGALYGPAQAVIEDALLDELVLPDGTASVSVSLDRVSLPMEEPRPRPVGRPRKGAAKKPCARVFRMAWVGTVTLHDATGEALYTRRHGRMPAADVSELAGTLLADVRVLLAKAPQLDVELLCDGAHELWNVLEGTFTAAALGRQVHRLVDLWHLLEKLGSAAQVLHRHPADAEATLRRWKLGLLNRTGYVVEIHTELEASGLEHVRRGEGCPVHETMTYIVNHLERMDYAAARQLGLPVGSGNVEATCKSLVATRMKRPGARWKETTGQHLLHLRALVLSDLWNPAMNKLFQQRPMAVKCAA